MNHNDLWKYTMINRIKSIYRKSSIENINTDTRISRRRIYQKMLEFEAGYPVRFENVTEDDIYEYIMMGGFLPQYCKQHLHLMLGHKMIYKILVSMSSSTKVLKLDNRFANLIDQNSNEFKRALNLFKLKYPKKSPSNNVDEPEANTTVNILKARYGSRYKVRNHIKYIGKF